MKHGVGRAVVAMVLAAWTTLTLLMINGGTQLVNQTSASVANSPLYNFQPVTIRLDRTNRDLTAFERPQTPDASIIRLSPGALQSR